MYVLPNYKTKKTLKEAIAVGARVVVFQPGPFSSGFPSQGQFTVEGPHYPEPHRWYAQVVVKDGKIITVA